MIKGIGVCEGIALGKVLIYKEEKLVIMERRVENVEEEKSIFKIAMEKCRSEIEIIRQRALTTLGKDKAEIFEAHLMILEDPEFTKKIGKLIEKGFNADFAVKSVAEETIEIFQAMDNEYLRERALDIKDVSKRILNNILGINNIDLSHLEEEIILVTEDLTPSVTATMDKERIKGFLTDIGGKTSHTAIMARTLEIPAVVGLKDITKRVKNGDMIVFDGDTGEVIINPDENQIKIYESKKEENLQSKKKIREVFGCESVTLDGRKVEVVGNISTDKDLNKIIDNDGEGIGLFRTEFLYMNRNSLPNEEEQYEIYKKVLSEMQGKPVVIRTLDIGGDKEVKYLNLEKESNPFLGYRAIRLCLDKKYIFKTQLRALLRASVYGNLRIMFPMISSLEELLQSKEVLNEAKEELIKEKIEFSEELQVGMMIEVPSAAIISDILAKHVDFFSIGTNDLIQYTVAVDRMNEKISHLYTPLNPGVLRLIKMTIDNAHKAGIWVGMCGETAGDKRIIPILLGLDLDEFSMSGSSILKARMTIRSLSMEEAKSIAEKVLKLNSSEEIEGYLDGLN